MKLVRSLSVPLHVLGEERPPVTRIQRGEAELAEIEAVEAAHPGVRLKRSDAAREVELRDFIGLERNRLHYS